MAVLATTFSGLPAPELAIQSWLEHAPVVLGELRGEIIILSFWDAAHPAAIRQLQRLDAWRGRYQSKGVRVLTVHGASFDFAHDPEFIGQTLAQANVSLPVGLDAACKAKSAYTPRKGPSLHVIDRDGRLCFTGSFLQDADRVEAMLDRFLEADDEEQWLLELQAVSRASDSFFNPQTDLMLPFGFEAGTIANWQGMRLNGVITYYPPHEMAPNRLYLEGRWKNKLQYCESVSYYYGRVHLQYAAHSVYLVVCSRKQDLVPIVVSLDNQRVPMALWGSDLIADEDGETLVYAGQPQVCHLLTHPQVEPDTLHNLTLQIVGPGVQLYGIYLEGARRIESPAAAGCPN